MDLAFKCGSMLRLMPLKETVSDDESTPPPSRYGVVTPMVG